MTIRSCKRLVSQALVVAVVVISVGLSPLPAKRAAAAGGLTWVSQASAADKDWAGVVWSPELAIFAAVSASASGNDVMTSPDGVNWTLRATPVTASSWIDIAWSPS